MSKFDIGRMTQGDMIALMDELIGRIGADDIAEDEFRALEDAWGEYCNAYELQDEERNRRDENEARGDWLYQQWKERRDERDAA